MFGGLLENHPVQPSLDALPCGAYLFRIGEPNPALSARTFGRLQSSRKSGALRVHRASVDDPLT